MLNEIRFETADIFIYVDLNTQDYVNQVLRQVVVSWLSYTKNKS